ncbi:MAG TPA: hypothetical protein VF069_14665 [Streptosporangiaceae bacterium]
MSAPWWFVVLGYAELIFVTCFFSSEAMNLVFRGWVTRMERTAHAVPPDRYFTRFGIPMITATTAACVGVGINLFTDKDPLQAYAGLLLIIVFLFVLGRYLLQDAARTLPPPLPRARLRRLLAEIKEELDFDTPMTPAEAALLQARLTRMSKVGDRLQQRAARQRWRDAIGGERRWLAAGVALAVLLPFIGVVRIAMRMARHDLGPEAWPYVGLLVAQSAAAIAGAVMRRIRLRRNLRDLGVELRGESEVLSRRLARLAAIRASRPSSLPSSPIRLLWDRLLRGRRG